MHETLPEDQLAEVFVCSQQNGVLGVGLIQNRFICDAGSHLGHVDDIMAVLSQPLDYGAVDTFIGDQVHADFAPTG